MIRYLIALLALIASAAPAATLDISACGGQPNGSDTTPAWNTCLAAAQSSTTDRTIRFGAGSYLFLTPPNPITADGITVTGLSPWVTQLVRAYAPSALTDPFITLLGRGSEISKLEIAAGEGTTGGYGLYIFTDNNSPPGGKHYLQHLRIAGVNHAGTWRVSLFMRGDGRTINPIGMRGVKMYNIEVFDATLWLVECWGCLVWDWYGGTATQGGGTAKGIAIGGTLPGVAAFKNRVDADVDWVSSSVAAGQMRGPGK